VWREKRKSIRGRRQEKRKLIRGHKREKRKSIRGHKGGQQQFYNKLRKPRLKLETLGSDNMLKCISELPSPFHQFGLLVALASAWSLTWYQSPGSRVRVLVFAIYYKNCCCPPLCPRINFLFSRLCSRVDFLFYCLCPRVDFLFSRHTWVGVLKCISGLYLAIFISSDF
jgi:hypothetical protein